jgi:hypothetical protein
MIYMEVKEEKTLSSAIEIYNSNMDDIIPKSEKNKKYQYISYLYNSYGFDFIDAVIDICILYRLSSPFAFFKTITHNFISSGITTGEQIEASRLKRKSRFNCSGRNYDYDVLEKKLLGW